MGYNTTVFILNDGFGELQRHPEDFVKGINQRMMEGGSVAVGNHANCVTVMPTAHADVFRLYGSHGNLMLDLSPYCRDTLELAKRRPDIVKQYIETARHLLERLESEIREDLN